MTTLRFGAPAMAMTALALLAATGCKAGRQTDARGGGQRAAADPPAAQHADPPAVGQAVAPVATAPRTQKTARGEDWNAKQIHWLDYTQGLAQAKTEHKPVCLVFFATWCPHCRNYSHVFEDPRVVAESKKFVMIRVDTDQEPTVSARYSLDGAYVPRTYFLTPGGKIAQAVRAPRPQFQYFYNEHDPASLLGGMQQAEKLVD